MTGCSAFGCSNRTEQGFSLKRFPIDPYRRKLWTVKIRRQNWVPTNNSYICEEHFEKDQFIDFDKKKLKKDAIPTLFSYSGLSVQRKMPTYRPPPKIIRFKSTDCNTIKFGGISRADGVSNTDYKGKAGDSNNTDIANKADLTNNTDSASKADGVSNTDYKGKADGFGNADYKGKADDSNNTDIANKADVTNNTDNANKADVTNKADGLSNELIIATLYKKLEECDKMIAGLQEKNFRLKAKLKNEINTSALLRFQIKKMKNEEKIQFFGDDQNLALKRKSMAFVKWSDETIEKALKLKTACGSSGYECILSLGFPFPSIRTLSRRFESNNPLTTSEHEEDELSSLDETLTINTELNTMNLVQ